MYSLRPREGGGGLDVSLWVEMKKYEDQDSAKMFTDTSVDAPVTVLPFARSLTTTVFAALVVTTHLKYCFDLPVTECDVSPR
jgi:hypothetical protein